MRRRCFSIILAVALLFGACKDVFAIYYDLTDEQVEQAIEYGESNKDVDYFLFLDEWMTIEDNNYEWAALNTKFSILACEAKRAALVSEKLTPTEIIQFQFEADETLSFYVVLYGNSADFAKDYNAVLLYKNKPIQPINVINDTEAKLSSLGVRLPTIYRAICRYDFPNYCVDSNAEVTLFIISKLSRERKFVFNLRAMR